jgi:hypothetical protein
VIRCIIAIDFFLSF